MLRFLRMVDYSRLSTFQLLHNLLGADCGDDGLDSGIQRKLVGKINSQVPPRVSFAVVEFLGDDGPKARTFHLVRNINECGGFLSTWAEGFACDRLQRSDSRNDRDGVKAST